MYRSFAAPGSRRLLGLRAVAGLSLLAAAAFSVEMASPVEARGEHPPPSPEAFTAQIPNGAKLYATFCSACHQITGAGVASAFPPLVGSEWVIGDERRLIRVVLHGLTGKIAVAGKEYSGTMPGWGVALKDPELAAVLSYVRSSWGNQAPPIRASTVAEIRQAHASRKTPWTAAELDAIGKER